MKILALCGSLREGSYNRMLLRAAAAAAPADVQVELHESLKSIPPFDGDELARGYPAAAAKLREAIRAADGVLFGSPEYNFSISGVLKNAIDWASRGTDQPFSGKPFAIVSASMGPLGGARSQYELRKIMVFLNAHALNKPEIFVGMAQTKFDGQGRLTDEATKKILGEMMAGFAEHVRWVKRGYATG
jgi:chromate reductase